MDDLSKEQIDAMVSDAVVYQARRLRRDIQASLNRQSATSELHPDTVVTTTTGNAVTWGGEGARWKPVAADTPDANPAPSGCWRVWAMLPDRIKPHLARVESALRGECKIRVGALSHNGRHGPSDGPGGVAVLPLTGFIEMQPSLATMFGFGTSTEEFTSQFLAALNDDSISHIVIAVDSPGGEVYGLPELSDLIFKSRGQKPITAVASPLAASAAYYIASAADRVFVTPSGDVGSIGTVAIHTDMTEAATMQGIKFTIIRSSDHKFEGSPIEPLSDESREYFQSEVDRLSTEFVSHVARNRGVSKSDVLKDFGQGRTLDSKAAKKVGMVDGIATLRDVLAGISAKKSRNSARRALSKTNLLTSSDGLR